METHQRKRKERDSNPFYGTFFIGGMRKLAKLTHFFDRIIIDVKEVKEVPLRQPDESSTKKDPPCGAPFLELFGHAILIEDKEPNAFRPRRSSQSFRGTGRA
ncbi:NADH dehydrogenase, chloroplast [Artemisia annua]|uniref:NADH dehydrogenase, chloroplast n=1 Tax=Artemisia annua TaxID=35608 RepID=A0A2U1QGJ9_ARTAN|nr:NADH dehydrogenase, chloroplast [Artemisia annua]